MGLSCDCETDSYDKYWISPTDFQIFDQKRGKRCRNCNEIIKPSDECLEFENYSVAKEGVEENIHGEGEMIQRGSDFLCEVCGGLWFNLFDMGYECVGAHEVSQSVYKYYQLVDGRGENGKD